MVESKTFPEEKKKGFNQKALMGDLLFNSIKSVGNTVLKTFGDLKVEGKENIPIRGKAILTTISNNVYRDMVLISNLTGRKVHFMLHPKIMKHQVAGPILKTLGMIRGTRDKDDTEPIDNVFDILNNKGNLIALTPEAKYDRDIQIKSMAGIIKFAIAGKAPIIPIKVYGEKSKLFNMIPITGIRVKVGTPITIAKRLNRDKFRSERYELAEDIIKIIDSLKPEPEFK